MELTKSNFRNILIFFGCALLVFSTLKKLHAAEHFESGEYRWIQTKIHEVVSSHQPSKVLVAFDIDNTLLKLNGDLASEPWFEWQAEGLGQRLKDPNPDQTKYGHLVATSFPELLKTFTMLLFLSNTTPVEPALLEILKDIQSTGAKVIALTARGPGDHDSTIREFNKHKIDFRDSAATPQDGFAGPYLPYDPQNLTDSGLSESEIQRLKLRESKPRLVQYNEGIFLGDGQHKGLMLRLLLAKTKASYESVIFVDNIDKNTNNVRDLFYNQPLHLVTIRYTREDQAAAQFKSSDKAKAIQSWDKLKEVLKEAF
jgi:hydroxymethylpyrimidine pyrophosphatase-like HAD family hydrolase